MHRKEPDHLLAAWLAAQSAQEAEQPLAQLIQTELEPLIKGVIRFKLRLASSAPEAEDLAQETLLEVLGELQKCRAQPASHAVSDVRELAATVAYRVCYRWLRRQSPQRNALRNRLQYLLTRKPPFALWPDALLLGLLYAQAGLPDEAERELRALQKPILIRHWRANWRRA